MIYAYRNAGKLDEGIRKRINEIVDKCEICKKDSKCKPKPSVAIPKAIEFNFCGNGSKSDGREVHIVDDLCMY